MSKRKRTGKENIATKKQTARDKAAGKLADFYRKHQKKVNLAILALLFLSCFFVRLNCIVHKAELHSDEVFSMMLSTCNPYYNQAIPDGTYTGAELKELIAASGEPGFSGAMDDIGQLWVNNADAPHASLYYMALRVALIGYDSFDVHDFVMRGGILNLLFFSLSFFLMYKLLRQIFGKRDFLVYVGLTIAFCNLLSLRNTMLLREYQMAETAVIALTWIAVRFVQRLRSGETVSWKRYLPAFAAVIGCLLSLGYFHAFYVIALGLCVAVACVRYHYRKGVLLVLLSGVASLAVALALYSGFFNFILHPSVHQTMAFRNFPLALSVVFLRDLPHYLFVSYGYWVVVAALLTAVFSKGFRKSLRSNPYFLWLPVVVLVCMPLIIYASVLKHPRYFYSLLPILSLIVPQAVSMMSTLWRRYFALLIVLFFPVMTVQIRMKENYGWTALSKEMARPLTIYRLNPNEIVQLVPSLSDKTSYTVLNGRELTAVLEKGRQSQVVSKLGKWQTDDFAYVGRLIWNKNIYLFDIKYVSPEDKK